MTVTAATSLTGAFTETFYTQIWIDTNEQVDRGGECREDEDRMNSSADCSRLHGAPATRPVVTRRRSVVLDFCGYDYFGPSVPCQPQPCPTHTSPTTSSASPLPPAGCSRAALSPTSSSRCLIPVDVYQRSSSATSSTSTASIPFAPATPPSTPLSAPAQSAMTTAAITGISSTAQPQGLQLEATARPFCPYEDNSMDDIGSCDFSLGAGGATGCKKRSHEKEQKSAARRSGDGDAPGSSDGQQRLRRSSHQLPQRRLLQMLSSRLLDCSGGSADTEQPQQQKLQQCMPPPQQQQQQHFLPQHMSGAAMAPAAASACDSFGELFRQHYTEQQHLQHQYHQHEQDGFEALLRDAAGPPPPTAAANPATLSAGATHCNPHFLYAAAPYAAGAANAVTANAVAAKANANASAAATNKHHNNNWSRLAATAAAPPPHPWLATTAPPPPPHRCMPWPSRLHAGARAGAAASGETGTPGGRGTLPGQFLRALFLGVEGEGEQVEGMEGYDYGWETAIESAGLLDDCLDLGPVDLDQAGMA